MFSIIAQFTICFPTVDVYCLFVLSSNARGRLLQYSSEGCQVKILSGFSENITNLDTGFRIPPLKSLTLSENHLNILPPEVFLGLNGLTVLNLGSSHIAHLSNASFKGLVSLQKLDLSLNMLYSVNAN